MHHQADFLRRLAAEGLLPAPAAHHRRDITDQDILPINTKNLVNDCLPVLLGMTDCACRHVISCWSNRSIHSGLAYSRFPLVLHFQTSSNNMIRVFIVHRYPGSFHKLTHRWLLSPFSSHLLLVSFRLFSVRNASTVLNALRNNGLPEKDRGLTGPIVIKEYWRLATSNAECGSLKSW